MCSPDVTERHVDAPDVAVGGGAGPGDQPRAPGAKQVRAQAAIFRQAEKMAVLDEEDNISG